MALNSYVYVPMGLPVTERAKLLVHSVDTNLRHYTFARTADYIDELCEKINAIDEKNLSLSDSRGMGTLWYLKILDFEAKGKP